MRASAHKFSQKVLGEAGLRLISTLFVLLLARRLGAKDFGRYSTALAYAGLCVIFADLGTNAILTREIARDPGKRGRIASASHLLKLLASAVSWLVLLAVTYALRLETEQRYVTLCLGIVLIGQTLTEYFCALLNGIEEMGWEASLKVLSRALGLSLGFLALWRRQPLSVIATSMAIGTAAGYAVSTGILKYRFRTFGVAFDVSFSRALLQSCLPLFGWVVFSTLYDSQDVLLLNYFRFTQQEIGWFSAAMKIIDVTRVYPVLMMGVFFPALSKLHLSDAPGFERKGRKLMIFMAVSLLVVAGVVYGLAPWIISLLYKRDFLPAARILRLLAPALILMGLNHIQMQTLIALNRERKILFGALLVCAANLIAACWLIPRCGLPGTCYALWLSEFVYLVFLRNAIAGRQPVGQAGTTRQR